MSPKKVVDNSLYGSPTRSELSRKRSKIERMLWMILLFPVFLLFGDIGEPGGSTEPAEPAQPAPTEPAPTEPVKPAEPEPAQKQKLFDFLNTKINARTEPAAKPVEPEPAADPTKEPSQEPAPTLIAGKFKSHEDLEKAYLEAEKLNTRLAQRHGLPEGVDNVKTYMEQLQAETQKATQLKTEAETAQRFMEMYKQTFGVLPGQQPGQPAQPAPQEGEPELTDDELADLMVTDPKKVLDMFKQSAEKAAESKLTAWQQEQTRTQQEHQQKVDHWKRQMADAEAVHPDIRDHYPAIQKIIEARPYLETAPDALLVAYNLAKAEQASAAPPQKSPDELLNDPDFQAKILANETIQQAILKGHAERIKAGQPPVVIGQQAGGTPPAAAKPEIKSISDASKAAKEFFAARFGGGQQ